MGYNFAVGTFLICLNMIVHVLGLIVVTRVVERLVERFPHNGARSKVLAMISVALGVFVVLSVEVWSWAVAYVALDLLPDLETAVYFSAVTFSTIGYGDVVPAPGWRMLAAFEGVAGLLLIGWSTAYLVAAGIRFGPFRTGVHF